MLTDTNEAGSLAPIEVVMPVAAWQFFGAFARHLNGKREARF